MIYDIFRKFKIYFKKITIKKIHIFSYELPLSHQILNFQSSLKA